MNETLALFIAIVLLTLSIIAYCIAIAAFFPKALANAEVITAAMPWRAFGVGLVNLLFFGTIALISAGVADSTQLPILVVPALVAIVLVSMGVSVGVSALARQVGGRVLPNRDLWRQLATGASVLTLASMLPFIGWFILLPYILLVGLGGSIISIFTSRGAPPRSEESIG